MKRQKRPETGIMQFGEDWPGVFIRGDNAANYAFCLRTLLFSENPCPLSRRYVEGLLSLLEGSNVANNPSPQFATLDDDSDEEM